MANQNFFESDFIRVNVEYRDKEHEKLLSEHPYPDSAIAAMKDFTSKKDIKIPLAEFLTYSMFSDLETGPSSHENMEALANNIRSFCDYFGKWFTLDNETIQVRAGHKPRNYLVEDIGVGVGLSVVSRVHGLTLADWKKIPVLGYKHLDFEYATDSMRVIQMEAKGTCVDNKERAGSRISSHVTNIATKKIELSPRTVNQEDDYPAMVRYGTIAAIDDQCGKTATCLLLDPAAEFLTGNPRDVRVIKRYSFISDLLSSISPYAILTNALRERLSQMVASENIQAYNGRLLDAPPLPLSAFSEQRETARGSFFRGIRNKAISLDQPFGGLVLKVMKNRRVFLGVHQGLMQLARTQDQETLLAFHLKPKRIRTTIETGPAYSHERFAAELHISSSGLAIGFEQTVG